MKANQAMDGRVCVDCGDRVEPGTLGDRCEGCRCYRMIPDIVAYQKAERHVRVRVGQDEWIERATRRPLTGIEWLDWHPVRVWDVMMMKGVRLRGQP